METDDLYCEAAFLCIAVYCDSCSAYRDELHPTELEFKYPDEGWVEALANAMRSEGWSVTRNVGGSFFDLKILCPNCSMPPR